MSYYRTHCRPRSYLSLAVTSPPQSFTEPLTVAQAAAFCKLSTPLSTDDSDELAGFISAAREQAEILQNRDLVVKQQVLTLDYWPSEVVELRAPLVSVESVEYRQSDGSVQSMVEAVGYLVDTVAQPGQIIAPYNTTWPSFTPWPTAAITINFTSGYSSTDAFWNDAGARIKVAMKRLIADWYFKRLVCDVTADGSGLPCPIKAMLSYGALERVR